MAKVLLFQCKNEAAIRQVLTPMKIKVISVPKEMYHLTLEELEKGKKGEECFQGKCPEESLMLLCDLTEKQLNRLLMELRKNGIQVDYKAVMTPTNRTWDVSHLYLEMAKEKAWYQNRKTAQRK